jgi:hypothetical protein
MTIAVGSASTVSSTPNTIIGQRRPPFARNVRRRHQSALPRRKPTPCTVFDDVAASPIGELRPEIADWLSMSGH